jgi:hypothetical protein
MWPTDIQTTRRKPPTRLSELVLRPRLTTILFTSSASSQMGRALGQRGANSASLGMGNARRGSKWRRVLARGRIRSATVDEACDQKSTGLDGRGGGAALRSLRRLATIELRLLPGRSRSGLERNGLVGGHPETLAHATLTTLGLSIGGTNAALQSGSDLESGLSNRPSVPSSASSVSPPAGTTADSCLWF